MDFAVIRGNGLKRIKRTLSALLLASTLFINVYKPSDHEQISESPTETQAEVAQVKSEEINVKPTQVETPKAQTFEATHYTSKCTGCSGITKTGDDVRQTIYANGYRVIAVDPNVIELRSIVRVTYADGTTFEAIASDIGGDIKNQRIDVLVANKDEMRRLGRQQVTVTIIQNGRGR